MASITLEDIPMELHAQLKNEAAANFRSLTQEAMSRLERTFQIDAALTSKRDQQWIDEAIASGPETPLTRKEMDTIRDRVKRLFKNYEGSCGEGFWPQPRRRGSSFPASGL